MADELYPYLGMKVRSAREAAGATQADLARRVRLSRSSIANIEAGRQAIYLHQAVALADALGQPLASLVPPPAENGKPSTLEQSHIDDIIHGSEEYIDYEAQ